MNAVKLKPRGKPFQPGEDPRRNSNGRRRSRATNALMEAITDDDLRSMWKAGLREAENGDAAWAKLIAGYLDGTPVGRNESGDPGAFDLDLSDVDTAQLKAALKRVK